MHCVQPYAPPGDKPRKCVRVGLVAPPLIRSSLVRQLKHDEVDIQLVGEAESEGDGVKLYFQVEPEVMVLDTRLVADEPARLLGIMRRIAPNAVFVSVVPAMESMQALAAAAVGADHICTAENLAATLASAALD